LRSKIKRLVDRVAAHEFRFWPILLQKSFEFFDEQ
jgi:hypothetical protein